MKLSMFCVVYSNGYHNYFIKKDIALRSLIREHLNDKHSSAYMMCYEESHDGTTFILKQKTFIVGLDTYMLQNGLTDYDVMNDGTLVTACTHHTFL